MENLVGGTEDLMDDIEYLKERRNEILDGLCEKIIMYDSPESIHKFLDTVLRANKQLKIAEDALIVYIVTQDNELMKKIIDTANGCKTEKC